MTAINSPPLCRGGRIFTDFAMCNRFSKNLGFLEYIKGLIGKGDQWSAWQYLGLVDALNGKQQADA
ncbi:hypothetical protein VZ191_16435, partial [Enterobacter roggenkampii]|uniref:hypothetical protein n=1 Tax=Enterobacter roggenkampii TaxID=1812935 RepID=UPI002E297879